MNLIVTDPKESKGTEGRITHGVIVINAKNKNIGSIMFREDKRNGLTLGVSFSGSAKPRVAFHTDNLEALKAYVKENNLQPGSKIEGYKIIVKESTTPFFDGQNPKMNPETAEVVKHNGADIYRQSVMLPKNDERSDSLLTNDAITSGVAQEIDDMVKETNEIN